MKTKNSGIFFFFQLENIGSFDVIYPTSSQEEKKDEDISVLKNILVLQISFTSFFFCLVAKGTPTKDSREIPAVRDILVPPFFLRVQSSLK